MIQEASDIRPMEESEQLLEIYDNSRPKRQRRYSLAYHRLNAVSYTI